MGHDPTEHVQEEIHHHATHGGNHGQSPQWIMFAALTAAFLAALAALTSSLATKHLTESTLTRIEANDNWSFYQSKSIKSSILDSRIYDAKLASTQPAPKDLAKKTDYEKEMPEIQEKAGGLEARSKAHLHTHETFEMAATMFHISIAIVAIAVVAKRREFWVMSMVGGIVGLYFFGTAFAHQPTEPQEKSEAAATTHVASVGAESAGAIGAEHAATGGNAAHR